MSKLAIIDAAVSFLSQVRHASDKDLDAALEVLAGRAVTSGFAATHEPYEGVCVSIQAEFRRRLLNNTK